MSLLNLYLVNVYTFHRWICHQCSGTRAKQKTTKHGHPRMVEVEGFVSLGERKYTSEELATQIAIMARIMTGQFQWRTVLATEKILNVIMVTRIIWGLSYALWIAVSILTPMQSLSAANQESSIIGQKAIAKFLVTRVKVVETTCSFQPSLPALCRKLCASF